MTTNQKLTEPQESQSSRPCLPQKKVKLRLVGLDGNAYALLGAFKRRAQVEGWEAEEILAVLEEAKAGDYNHLLRTLMAVTEE